jgi:predicted DNA-binding ribbon-helix-helix protein
MPKSLIAKRSIVFNDHKTSVGLEDEFWSALKQIADKRGIRLSHLVAAINEQREHANLSSALRLLVLEYYQSQRSDAE